MYQNYKNELYRLDWELVKEMKKQHLLTSYIYKKNKERGLC